MNDGPERPTLHPSRIAQFFSLGQCPMYLYHEYDADIKQIFETHGIDEVPLSPLLAETGNRFEAAQLDMLLATDAYIVGPAADERATSFDETWTTNVGRNMRRLENLVADVVSGKYTRPVICYQTPLKVSVGVWPVRSEIDILFLVPTEGGARLHIAEVKSAAGAKTHHQLQTATYTLQLRSLLSAVDGLSLTAGIVSQATPLSQAITARGEIDLTSLPTFDTATRENDIELLLEEGGPLDAILRRSKAPAHSIDAKCDGCSHQAQCLAYAALNHGLELLQLSESAQESLQTLGVTKLEHMAELYELPTDKWDRSATNYADLTPRDPELVARIQEETEVTNLPVLSQIAHRFLRALNPAFDAEWRAEASAGPWSEYLVGSGRNLPDDDPYDEDWDEPWDDYPKRSLVRIYPVVVHDYVRDRLVYLGARVTSSRHEDAGGDPITVIARPDALPDASDAKDAEEERLFEAFFDGLEDAVATVAPDLAGELGPDEKPLSADEGFVHLYFYGRAQRNALMDAVKRHPDTPGSRTFRTLLGYRGAVDQEAVSVLKEEFRDRHVFRYPGLGLLQTVAQFYDVTGKRTFNWESTREAGETPLKHVFARDFFETTVPCEKLGPNTVGLDFSAGFQVPPDRFRKGATTYYPVLGRHRDVVPLEYVWACEELDVLNTSWASDDETRQRIVSYRHHTDKDSPRVTLDDIDELIERIAAATEYIERCIRDKDSTTPKTAVPVRRFDTLSFEPSALQQTCIEYQQLEHGTKRRALELRLRQPVPDRVSSGQAVAFECSSTPDENDETISGTILDHVGAGTSGEAGPLSIEPGSWVVVTPLTENADGSLTETVAKPAHCLNSTLAIVDTVDRTTGTITLSAPWKDGRWPRRDDPSMTWHRGWTSDPVEAEKYTTLVEEGSRFVVDTALDNYSAYRARHALVHARTNAVHERFLQLYEDGDPAALRIPSLCDSGAVSDLLDAVDRVNDFAQNPNQRALCERLTHFAIGVQGVPGAGKTSGAAAPAALSRAHAFATANQSFAGLLSAHSNTAVNELLEDVASLHENLATEGFLKDLTLVRVRSAGQPTGLANVEDVHYRHDADRLRELYTETFGSDGTQVLFFTTPVTARNMLNVLADDFAADADGEVDVDKKNRLTIEDLMATGDACVFDFMIVDEASMMDLPLLFLLGAFLREEGQIILVGDHRQMQPIQSHEWDEEDRQPIEEHTPAISALDFVRFLRGENGGALDSLKRESPTWADPDAVLPMDRLRITYRNPQPMGDLFTRLSYHLDGIEIESGVDNPLIPDVRSADLPEWVRVSLEPESRATLIVHDENRARKNSPLEAFLTEQVLDPLPTTPTGSGNHVSTGVVVPFRLQRRRLRRQLPGHILADTVEKFQGGERDVMVLSMTAGSQGYVNSQTDFLLNPNRLIVGASRMRRKLIIIASKSLFRAVTPDADDYENQKAWKQLYREFGVHERDPDAVGSVTSTEVPDLDADQEVTFEVYNGFRD
ncbi:AAA domain-containing protein [Haladaptatus sp. YSMS36]|uniref:AAA domain-containing protein n=1 Tax=Haladaptatus sp. YSMS36 TaxID=3033384 RepID=UPI0023E8C8F2|nr:AAA domain-containing protein [Haladaptatus sp. YSMS36]